MQVQNSKVSANAVTVVEVSAQFVIDRREEEMVFTKTTISSSGFVTGMIMSRDTGKYTTLLIFESVVGMLVALSNIMIIFILIAGWKRLMKNTFYIIVFNLIVCTSMKAVVELAFVVPYYIMRGEKEAQQSGYFSNQIELAVFNASIFADYGVLFFSVLIALNRYLAIARSADARDPRSPKRWTALSCVLVWICSAVIPLLFFFCDCQFKYEKALKLYYNHCERTTAALTVLLNVLIYLTYGCTVFVLVLYLLVFIFLRKQRKKREAGRDVTRSNRSSVEMKLLRQSIVIFTLYAGSIFTVLLLSFVDPGKGIFDLAYAENLLNLSIAAVYPICFLAMSGEMKTILIAKITPSVTGRVQSVSLNHNNNNNPNNEIT